MTEYLKKRGFYQHYNKIFEEWEENGIIERIQSDKDDTLEYFLPHRAVVKSGSSTTPVRPVFDASCKTKGGWSLNDCLTKGPNLLELIPDIMLRFRLNKIGVVADIEKAFLQISVAKEDRQFLRFLWWEDGKQENLRICQHKRVVFGVTSSPFLLAATLKLHLEQYEREVIPLLKCMKWETADDTMTISDKLIMSPTYKSFDRENDAEIENQTHKLTKRIMLSKAHAVFDPLGLFSPFTIVPKIILQQCWKSELKWDQPVSEDIEKKFVEWQSQIPELLSVRIPRSWNQFDPIFDEEEINKELKKTVNIAVNSTKDNFMDKLERYGDYHRIVRIVAYLLRFKRKTVSDQSRPGQHDKMSKEISVEEFEEAEKVVLRHVQLCQLYFGEDDYDTRCPIVIPGENQVVKLLIRKEHEMMSHAGIQTTQQLVRRRFWILKGKRTIRSIISACATCRRYNSKRVQTESIPIPATRIGSTPAFGVIGVDLAGPLTESGGKKIWVVLYTCAVYRAVHLELTKTVSTEGFLDTFRRFVARRGRPSIVYSDNGLNFVGCNNLFKKVNWNDVLCYATVQRIKWNFNPPTAAFWGGWWERLVGLMKQLIRKVFATRYE
ncbi:hypothetical protein LAZ67_10001461 [Cordylochernes scorpioides]|uniref:Integrase catalytic domain-containing protein n=1 Tax=Cordylochernes scorpioides TaxID=51811 RepID=A0ABY6L0T2_9ARAC|nr:hypothetical protein LAZ67_10001461 [Cordylochernes scorpioides]